MSINEFLKKMRQAFPDMEFRVKDANGRVFKSVGWDDATKKINKDNNYGSQQAVSYKAY